MLHIGLRFRERAIRVGQWLADEFDGIAATINQFVDSYLREHNEDGTHSDIHADNVEISEDLDVGGDLAVTGSGAFTSSITTASDLGVAGNIYERGRLVPMGNWQAYTPTMVLGLTALGNGSLTGRYTLIGNTMHFWGRLIVGSTTTFSGTALVLSLPFSSPGASFIDSLHFAMLNGTTSKIWDGQGYLFGPSAMSAQVDHTTVTNLFPIATPPTNSQITWSGTIEMA